MKKKRTSNCRFLMVFGISIIIIFLIFFIGLNATMNSYEFRHTLMYINAPVEDEKSVSLDHHNKHIVYKGKLNGVTYDPDYDISFRHLAVQRITYKYDGRGWNSLGGEVFKTNEIKIDQYTMVGYEDQLFEIGYRPNNIFPKSIDLSISFTNEKIPVPTGYKLYTDYMKHSGYSGSIGYSDILECITNSEDVNNPKVGDIRIYYKSMFDELSNSYIVLDGVKIKNKIVNDNSYNLLNVFINSNNADIYTELNSFINMQNLKALIILIIIPFIGFYLLILGLSKMSFFIKKFGQIKKYKIFLLSLLIDIIIILICFLIMWY